MTREQAWANWMALKEDLHQIAGIVQNDGIELTEDDWLQWLKMIDSFKVSFHAAQMATMRLKK